MNENTEKETHSTNYKLYSYRFVILICFILSSFQTEMALAVFAPIQTLFKKTYHLSYQTVNFGTISIQNVSNFPGIFIGNYIFDYVGIRSGVLLGSFLTILGMWIRVFCTSSYIYIFIGQFFIGVAQPLFDSTTQTISSIWFGPKERIWSTSLLYFMLDIAPGVGALFPSYYITDPKKESSHQIILQIQKMCMDTAILATLCCIPVLIFIRSKPLTPPCQSVAAKRLGYVSSFKGVFKNLNCLKFLVGCSLLTACGYVQGDVFQGQLKPFGLDLNQASIVFSLSNILNPPFYLLGILFYKWMKSFKSTLFILFGVWVVASLFQILVFEFSSLTFVSIYYVFIGNVSSMAGALPFEFLVELSYPVGETTVCGVFVLITSIFTLIINFICSWILDDITKWNAVLVSIIIGVFLVIGLYFIKNVKEEKNRENYHENEIDEPLAPDNSLM